jgi:predicted ester cyclase
MAGISRSSTNWSRPSDTCHVGGFPAGIAVPADPEGWKQRATLLRTGFLGLHLTIEGLLAAANKVVVRYRVRGTHRGSFWGFAPTGKGMGYTGIMILRLRHGQLAEEWTEADLLGLTRQIGASPEQ